MMVMMMMMMTMMMVMIMMMMMMIGMRTMMMISHWSLSLSHRKMVVSSILPLFPYGCVELRLEPVIGKKTNDIIFTATIPITIITFKPATQK